MLEKIKSNKTFKLIFDSRNIGLYIVAIITLSVTWSSIKTIQHNYELQKQITRLQQEVDVLDQQTKNQKLKNEYYKTDAYLDIAVRKYFGKAYPGEQVISVPKDVALKYAYPEPKNTEDQTGESSSGVVKNWQEWLNFFLHRQE